MNRVIVQSRRHGQQLCAVLLIALTHGGCSDGSTGTAVAATVANPTMPGTTCEEREVTAADAGPDCEATFSDCTDGLDYKLECEQKNCVCLVDGVQQGSFVAEVPRCDVDIALLKIACGWVKPGVQR